MKAMKRRLLSLLLAMAMVCTLVPSALAVDSWSGTISAPNAKAEVPTTLTLSNLSLTGNDTQENNGAYTATSTNWSVTQSPTGVSQNPTVDSNGSVTFPAAGVYTVQATGAAKKTDNENVTGNYTVSQQITVAAADTPYVTAVNITPASVELTLGSNTISQVLSASVTMSSGTDTEGVTWAVKSGADYITWNEATKTVTAKAEGTAVITATAVAKGQNNSTVSKDVTIKVNPAALPTFTIIATPASIAANGQTTLTIPATTSTGAAMPTYNGNIAWEVTANSTLAYLNTSTTAGTSNTLYGRNQTNSNGTVKVKATLSYNGTAVAIGTVDVTVNAASSVIVSTSANGQDVTNVPLAGYGSQTTLYARYSTGATDSTNYRFVWSVTGENSIVQTNNSNQYYSNQLWVQAIGTGTATIDVTAYNEANQVVGTKRVTISVTSTGLQPSVTVYSDTEYIFSDTDAKGKASVADQIYSLVRDNTGRYLYSVIFTQTTNTYGDLSATRGGTYYADGVGSTSGGRLKDIVFTPRQTGTATFSFTAYYATIGGNVADNAPLYGTLSITVTGDTTAGDIPYTASIGDDVYFDMGDFEDFYYSKTSRGTLEYVTFTMPSGGYLYSDRSRLSSSNATCYVSPRSTQNDLGSVYFSPTGTTASKATTVRVGFTAYGNRSGGVSGTVAITYLNGAAKDITYSTVGGSVTLDHQDFIDAYKEVTGKTAPSNLTIQFQEVPASGTLTYTGGSRDVDLTKSNVRSNKYSTKTTGSYRLNQLTYTGTRGTDTIEYIAYSGSAAQFTGKVVFNGTAAVPTDVVVTYGSTGGQAVLFSQNDFVRANSVMSNAVKVRFVVPTNGTLTMNGANAAGIDIASSLLGSVSYKPKAGFNGTDRIIFAAYDSRNQLVASGSVNITVVGNTGTSTTTPGGVTDVSQFKDVSSTAWYRNDLATLVSQGIITGKGEGKFDPLGTVTYGEALKMILEACGYTATLGTGSNWAINYKNLAVSNGWISSSIELNAAISRNATAELAARVMGVAPATSGSPFADEANAYAVALYYTNPQIFVGDNTTGKLLFKNGSPLLRQEVCAVICRVRNYHTQHTTNTMPDGI